MSREERNATPPVDYFRPIIADGDTGHGGNTAIMKLTKLFIGTAPPAIAISLASLSHTHHGTRRAWSGWRSL
jgi:isocitrate lyase